MVRFAIAIVLCSTLLACTTSRYFAPTNSTIARKESATCSGARFEYAELVLDSDRSIQVSMAPTDHGVSVAITAQLERGDTFKMSQPTISLSIEASGQQQVVVPLSAWRNVTNSAYGIKSGPSIAADRAIVVNDLYTGPPTAQSPTRYGFETLATAQVEPARRYTVTLPPMELNGRRHSLLPILMERREESGLSLCLQ
jgi:hypothetical protein